VSNDEDIDEALRETSPASDPPAYTVETGTGAATPPPSVVRDNRQANRFDLTVGVGEVAETESGAILRPIAARRNGRPRSASGE
jgi:hypothetical protein